MRPSQAGRRPQGGGGMRIQQQGPGRLWGTVVLLWGAISYVAVRASPFVVERLIYTISLDIRTGFGEGVRAPLQVRNRWSNVVVLCSTTDLRFLHHCQRHRYRALGAPTTTDEQRDRKTKQDATRGRYQQQASQLKMSMIKNVLKKLPKNCEY